MNIQHSSRTDSWGTPLNYIEAIKTVLGSIDVDPASSLDFNSIVQAKRILTEEDNALQTSWNLNNESVYLNPPGGKIDNKSKSILFWCQLMHWKYTGKMTHAIYMGFSLEQLQSSQRKGVESIVKHTICIPAKRISFTGQKDKNAPSHSNVIVYVPGTINKTYKFKDVFSQFGEVSQ